MSSDGTHKRKWRNLLLNKGYQLRFTLFMVGLSSALMIGLGIWVMRVADETTEVSKASVMGTPCPAIPNLIAPPAPEPPPSPPPVPMNLEEAQPQPQPPQPPPQPASGGSAADAADAVDAADDADAADDVDAADADADEPHRRKIIVSLDPMELPKRPRAVLPADYAGTVVKHWTCRLKIDAAKRGLEHGRDRILWVMVATGLLLVLGLAAYGIKMTHKVAGPLFKVGLYFNKMRDGRFDKVYNLRKGDQLVDFYEHFRHAHAGVVKMQQADIERVRAVIAAAEAAGAGDDPAVGALRALLARKERSIE